MIAARRRGAAVRAEIQYLFKSVTYAVLCSLSWRVAVIAHVRCVAAAQRTVVLTVVANIDETQQQQQRMCIISRAPRLGYTDPIRSQTFRSTFTTIIPRSDDVWHKLHQSKGWNTERTHQEIFMRVCVCVQHTHTKHQPTGATGVPLGWHACASRRAALGVLCTSGSRASVRARLFVHCCNLHTRTARTHTHTAIIYEYTHICSVCVCVRALPVFVCLHATAVCARAS